MESLVPVLFLQRPLGEAGRITEGSHKETQRVGVEEVRDAERGKEVLSNSLDGHQPDVETIWRRRAGGGGGRKRTK